MTVRKNAAKLLSPLIYRAALGAEGRRFESFRPDHLLWNGDKHLAACSLPPSHQAVFLTDPDSSNGGKTGSPPGLLQDDDRKLHRWFAGRVSARHDVRRAMEMLRAEQETSGRTGPVSKPATTGEKP